MSFFKAETVSLKAIDPRIEQLEQLNKTRKNDFADSLVKQWLKKRSLSDKQWFHVEKLVAQFSAPAPAADPALVTKIDTLHGLMVKGLAVGYADFAASLVTQFRNRGSLSEKQWQWVDRITAEASAAEASAAAVVANVQIDEKNAPKLLKLENVIEVLKSQRQFLVGAYKFKRGNAGGFNIIIAHGDRWIGAGNSQGFVTNGIRLTAGDRIALEAIAKLDLSDLIHQIAEEGKQTGVCGICTRTLTDPESIAAGIGPICAAKFGFKV